MYCKECGNELSENTTFCDKCGARQDVVKKQEQTNVLSIVGIIVAGISIFLNFWGIVGIAAVIISSIALLQINKSNEKGKGIAITGISIGALSVLYGFMVIILFM